MVVENAWLIHVVFTHIKSLRSNQQDERNPDVLLCRLSICIWNSLWTVPRTRLLLFLQSDFQTFPEAQRCHVPGQKYHISGDNWSSATFSTCFMFCRICCQSLSRQAHRFLYERTGQQHISGYKVLPLTFLLINYEECFPFSSSGGHFIPGHAIIVMVFSGKMGSGSVFLDNQLTCSVDSVIALAFIRRNTLLWDLCLTPAPFTQCLEICEHLFLSFSGVTWLYYVWSLNFIPGI